MRNKTETQCGAKPCIDGVYRQGKKNFVGYCRYKKHRGFITEKLLKKHQCPAKGCHYFEKFESSPYWKNKAKNKQLKKDRKAEEQVREAREAFILETARSWTEKYGFMDFTSAREPKPGRLVLTYFAQNYIDLSRCRNYMSRVWNCYVELRSIKPDRQLEDRFLNKKKERVRK